MIRRLVLHLLLAVLVSTAALVTAGASATHASALPTTAAESPRIDPLVKVADLDIPLGQTISVENGAIDLTFTRIVEDSRCPKNLQCYLPGRAVVELRIRHLDGTETDEMLTTAVKQGHRPPALGLPTDGYILFLASLTPYPERGVPQTEPNVVTVRITRP